MERSCILQEICYKIISDVILIKSNQTSSMSGKGLDHFIYDLLLFLIATESFSNVKCSIKILSQCRQDILNW